MRYMPILAGVITFLVVMAAGSALIAGDYLEVKTSSSPEIEQCNSLYHNDEASINLLFFASEEKTKEYADFLLKETAPYNQNPESFNVFYISDYIPECEIYQGIATFCYSKDLIKKAASCPYDYVIVLDEQAEKIRSSAYQNILSINSAHPKTVLSHEFGHTFANFAEEYVEEGARVPFGSKNCQSSCEEFGDETNGCFEGCTKSSLVRSIENGVMRTLASNEYGEFNSKLILERVKEEKEKKKILNEVTGTITGEVISNCEEQEYYLVETQINPTTGESEIIHKTLEQGCAGTNGYGQYGIKYTDKNGNIILERSFSNVIFTDGIIPETETELRGETFEEEVTYFTVPTTEEISSLEIEDKNGDSVTKINLGDVETPRCVLTESS